MSNFDGFNKFQAERKAKRSKSKFPYTVAGNKIVIGNKKYTLKGLYILAYLVEFLSLDLCIMGLIRVLYYSSLGGIPYIIIGACLFWYGLNYRKIATEVKNQSKAAVKEQSSQESV